MKDCVLITGGAGFIGSALSTDLFHFGMDVVAVDSFLEQVHPSRKRSEFLDPRVVLIKGDVRSPETWTTLLAEYRPLTIIHLAAETGTAQSLTEATRHASVNVVGTTEMLDALTRADVRPKRILLASSRAVYGEGKWQDPSTGAAFYPLPRTHETLAAGLWVPEAPSGQPGHPLPHRAAEVFPKPTSIYGSTKLAQEHILTSWCGAFGVPLSILRLQNVYGEGQSPFNSYTGIINVFHRMARAGQSIPVYEDGLIGRDFVHVDDVVAAMMACLKANDSEDHLLDVGTGVKTTILDAAMAIAEIYGAPAPHICGKFRDGDVRSAVADVTDLTAETMVKPAITFPDGSKRVGDWLVSRGHI